MSRVWWCRHCRVPLLKERCELCGCDAGEPVASELIPVFATEMALLRDGFGLTELPQRTRDCYLWTSGSAYYRHGHELARVSFRGGSVPFLEVTDGSVLRKRPRRSFPGIPLAERVRLANASRLHALEYEACAFIEEVLHKYAGRVPVVAFSGGKDSTAVSLLARRVLPAADLLHVFGDTGIESPDTVDFMETFRRDNPQIPLIAAQPQSDFFELCETLGPPSRIKRWCCSTQKVFPLGLVYGVLSEQRGVLTLCGVRRVESSRRQAHKRVLTDTKIANEVMASPILEWSDTQVWLFLMSQNQQVNRAYRRGFRRVGCMYCPYESKWSEYLKTVYHPEQVKEWECLVNGYYRSRAKNQTAVPGIDRWKARAGGLSRSDDLSSLTRRPCTDDTSSFSIACSGSVTSGFWEYMRPFGNVRISYDDGMLSHGQVLDETGDVLFDMRVSRPRGHIRVTLHAQKNQRLLSQRITRQIRKAQACVLCGFCQIVCPANAISCNGHYAIDPDRCVHCLRCVREVRGGCVAAHATRVTGSR